ncbi:MAG: cytochrome c biogenesis protein ResB [Tenacibaculum sp.]
MKKILNTLYSTRLTAMLFILFAIAMGVATFIENEFGTQTAKALVYNAWWFELIMIFFVLNFFGNIFRYRLYKKQKWTVLLFHLAFLFILTGAGITRYISYEGLMVIDEGETTNTFLSDTNYLNVIIDNGKFQKETNNKLLLSAWGNNSVSFTENFWPQRDAKNYRVNFELVNYIPWSEKKFVVNNSGKEHLFLVESSGGSRHEHYIKSGTVQNIHNILVGFETPENTASINFFYQDKSLKMLSKNKGTWLRMADQKSGNITKDSIQHFQFLTLHQIGGLDFVVPNPPERGVLKTVRGKKDKNKFDTVVFDISVDKESKRISFYGGQFNIANQKDFSIGNLNFRAWYGAKQYRVPFGVKLNDFQLEKYPGSENASSYASEVTVIPQEKNKKPFNFRIFMNHILNYKGYRLFQASYANAGQQIEQTHLSINYDSVGTAITYLGYFLLFFGLIASLFAKNTRFSYLKKSLTKIRDKKAMLTVYLLLTGSFLAVSQHKNHKNSLLTDAQLDSILQKTIVSKQHAKLFSSLVIQDAGGRMKPAHTFASELVRKVSHTDNFRNLTPSQILVSITGSPMLWLNIPFIYLEKGNTQIRETLSLPKEAKYARFIDFYKADGSSKISHLVIEAQKKRIQNKFEQDIIKIERRIWLFSQALSGSILRIYPVPNNSENKWVSKPETSQAKFKGIDSVFVRQSLPLYFQFLNSAKKTGDYTQASKILNGIKKFQQKYGAQVMPSLKKIELEINYNEANIFVRLSKYYGYVSSIMIFLVFFQIFNNKLWLAYVINVFIAIVLILFFMHIVGLLARWYISGNAPWSNA